jgi:hypothetical protein
MKSPYIASMGVYVFKTDILLKLLRWRYPTANDFGSEIIPAAVMEHNVQVREILKCSLCFGRRIIFQPGAKPSIHLAYFFYHSVSEE